MLLYYYISYVCTLFNIVAVYNWLSYNGSVGLIDPPVNDPSIATTGTIAPTPTVCEPSPIDPSTIKESIFQAFHSTTCLSETSPVPTITLIPNMTSPIYLRKFVKAPTMDAHGRTRLDTVIFNYLKEDEAVVNQTIQRTVMMVAKQPETPPYTPKTLLGKVTLLIWLVFLNAFKLVYWIMFAYSSYICWNKYVVQI